MPRRKKSEAVEPSGHQCYWAGCEQAGNFKAPLHRDRPGLYQWFCEAHITEFNKNWDYFSGMTEDQIYAFQKDAQLGGTRPTWTTSEHARNLNQKLHAAFDKMFSDERVSHGDALRDIPLSAKVKDALAVLDLQHPCDRQAIKSQYRELVKKYHPDVNKGSPLAEEAFKNITMAYSYLIEHYVSDPA